MGGSATGGFRERVPSLPALSIPKGEEENNIRSRHKASLLLTAFAGSSAVSMEPFGPAAPSLPGLRLLHVRSQELSWQAHEAKAQLGHLLSKVCRHPLSLPFLQEPRAAEYEHHCRQQGTIVGTMFHCVAFSPICRQYALYLVRMSTARRQRTSQQPQEHRRLFGILLWNGDASVSRAKPARRAAKMVKRRLKPLQKGTRPAWAGRTSFQR